MYLALLAQRAIKLLRRHKSSGKRNTTIFYFVLFTKFSRSFTYLTFRFIVKNQKHSACSLFTMLFAAWRVLQMCERKPNWTSCHQNYSWSYIILCLMLNRKQMRIYEISNTKVKEHFYVAAGENPARKHSVASLDRSGIIESALLLMYMFVQLSKYLLLSMKQMSCWPIMRFSSVS